MPPNQIIASLQPLQRDSGKRISNSVIVGMTRSLGSGVRSQLLRSRSNPNGAGFIYVPTNGTASVLQHTQAVRKLMTLSGGAEGNFTYSLNTALLGGTSYPVLTAVLGTIAGAASAGAGLLFTVASTAVSLTQTAQRVLARVGDELWQVEEIGKAPSSGFFSGNTMAAVHVSSFFLVDPYRSSGTSRSKGWLIHEERTELTLL